jgi:hypothetical protein
VSSVPYLHMMPRVRRDINRSVKFVAQQPWGKPAERSTDIQRGIVRVLRSPKLKPVRVRRPATGIELRRSSVAQFVIVYAFLQPSPLFPNGIVSIRAVRHSRVRNVFSGVREPEFGTRVATLHLGQPLQGRVAIARCTRAPNMRGGHLPPALSGVTHGAAVLGHCMSFVAVRS